MKFKKFCLLAVTALAFCSLTACNEANSGTTNKTKTVVTQSNDNKDKKYQIFLLAQESGYTGTYEEWLESIKGDSITIIVNEGKLQWKYSKETTYRDLLDLTTLKGEDGKSPVVTIGENGNWFIDGTDTEIRARANDGKGIETISKTNTEGLVDTYTITFTDGTTAIFTVTNGSNGSNGTNGEKGDTGNGIRTITKGESSGLVDTYIITFTDGTTSTFVVTNGKNGNDGAPGAAGKGITSIIKGDTVGLVDSYIIVFSDGTTFTYNVTNGAAGQDGSAGAAGNGISKVEKTNTVGLVDTYTITFTDGTTSTFTITNGAAGQDGSAGAAGNGIESIAKTGNEDLVDTYTITFTDGTTTTFTVTNGSQGTQGIQGATGNGISSIAKTDSEGLVDTYTITFTDGTTTTFTVTNGQDATANDKIVEYSNNGLTKTEYEYDGDLIVKTVSEYKGSLGWVLQTKLETILWLEQNYRYEFNYIYDTDNSCWVGTEENLYQFYDNGTVREKRTYLYDTVENKWITDTYTQTDYYTDGRVYRTCGYKYIDETCYKYGDEIFSRPQYEGSTVIRHIWASETSGETSQEMEIYGVIRIDGVKKWQVYIEYEKETLESDFVMTYFDYVQYDEQGEVESSYQLVDNFPYYTQANLYILDYSKPISSHEYIYYRFVYSPVYYAIIPDRKVVNIESAFGEDISRDQYYDYNPDTKEWQSKILVRVTSYDTDGYFNTREQLESIMGSPLRLTQKTVVLQRDEDHQIIQQIDSGYDANGNATHVWRGTTTYHDNGSTASFIYELQVGEDEWQNYWKYECPKLEGGYGWVEYHWDADANDWVEGAPDWNV